MEARNGEPEVLETLGVGRRRSFARLATRLIAAALLLALVIVGVVWRKRAAEPKAEQWLTAEVERGDLRETVLATGTLNPLDSVEVGAEVTGRVIKVHVDVNDQVEEGQVLVEIDTEELQARLEEAQAQLKSAQASQKNAEATIKETQAKALRTLELRRQGLVSDQDLEAADAALDRAKAGVLLAAAQVTVSRAALKSSSTSFGKAIIRSPISGIVLARSVEPGQTVTAGFQTPVLFTLARDLSQMQLKVDVDEADVGKVREGQAATFVVDAYPKREFSSKVVRLSNLPKGGTTVITYEAVLTVDNSERLLRPGMTATATIVTSEKEAVLSVPNAALRFQPPAKNPASAAGRGGFSLPGFGPPSGMRGGNSPRAGSSSTPGGRKAATTSAVWVQRGGHLERVAVQAGSTDGRRTEVTSSKLEPGAAVVVDVAEGPE